MTEYPMVAQLSNTTVWIRQKKKKEAYHRGSNSYVNQLVVIVSTSCADEASRLGRKSTRRKETCLALRTSGIAVQLPGISCTASMGQSGWGSYRAIVCDFRDL